MGHLPHYKFADFKESCKNKNVIPINSVLADANRIFNLKDLNAIQDFIANDGLEDLKFINSTNWRNNKQTIEIIVDAYEFITLDIMGYISFMYNSKSKIWIIKSFHENENSNPVLRNALQRAGINCYIKKLIEDKK